MIPLIVAGMSLLGGLAQKKQDKKMAEGMRTNLADRFVSGIGGMGGYAGDQGAGYNLGALEMPFWNSSMFANRAGEMANNALTGGVPGQTQQDDWMLRFQDMDLGTFGMGESGARGLAGKSLMDAFRGFNPDTIAQEQLARMRAADAPLEAQQQAKFVSDLYGSGRGAVTGAPGNEGSMGGGRLAAAFAEGLGRKDLQRQVMAQEMGINTANASEGLLRSAFSRFADMSSLGADMNQARFGRQRGMLEGNYARGIDMAGMPAKLAAAFQSLAGAGVDQASSLAELGLAHQTSALDTAVQGANARVGSGGNVAAYMRGRSATPALDGMRDLFAGMARPKEDAPEWEQGAGFFRNLAQIFTN